MLNLDPVCFLNIWISFIQRKSKVVLILKEIPLRVKVQNKAVKVYFLELCALHGVEVSIRHQIRVALASGYAVCVET